MDKLSSTETAVANKVLITFIVMLVTILEVLDMTIVNVALPPMMGSLGANNEEITWVLTSYIVAAAILMPLTGWLIERLGQKTLLLGNIIGFCASSMLCGMASSLGQMVLFRAFQGLFGASLVPLSQFILRTTYPKSEQGKAMALWGMGVMVAPILGPTLGGYITEWLNWRWIFFINVPFCLLALFLTFTTIKQTPTQHKPIDVIGLCLLVVSIGALQLFLDQGNSHDWLESNYICFLLSLILICGSMFIYKGIKDKANIIDLNIFKDRNFWICNVLILGYLVCLFGVIALQPMLLENLLNYPIAYTGLLMAPRGLASAITMAFVAGLMNKLQPKTLIFVGLVISFIGGRWLADFQLGTSEQVIVLNGIVQGIGMGLFFVPVSTIALSTLPATKTGEASGIFSLARSMGSSIGVAVMSMLAAHQTQVHYQSLASHLSIFNPNLQALMTNQNIAINHTLGLKLLEQKVLLQANFNAFINCFLGSCYGFLCLLPLVLLLRNASVDEDD